MNLITLFFLLFLIPISSFSLHPNFTDHSSKTHLINLDSPSILALDSEIFTTLLFFFNDKKKIYFSFPQLPLSYPSIKKRYPYLNSLYFRFPQKKINFDLIFASTNIKKRIDSLFASSPSILDKFFFLNHFIIDPSPTKNLSSNSLFPHFISLLGNIFYKRDKVDAFFHLKKEIVSKISEQTKSIYVNDRARILYVEGISPNGFLVPTYKDHYVFKMIRKIGAFHYYPKTATSTPESNQYKPSYHYVHTNDILEFNPSIILFPSDVNPFDHPQIWEKINARSLAPYTLKTIYSIPQLFQAWDKPGIESILFFIWASILFYPKIFEPYFNCDDVINRIFKFLYDFKLTKDEIRKLFNSKDMC